MAYISRALRQWVTERAHGRCEYCQTAQSIVIEMEIDHIVPEVAGGVTEPDNLCLACISYNAFKSAYQTGVDPQTREEGLFSIYASNNGMNISIGMTMGHRLSA